MLSIREGDCCIVVGIVAVSSLLAGCVSCRCLHGRALCEVASCPPAACADPLPPDPMGCCPTCPNR